MIIFDELKYAEDIIKNGYKNKKYTSYDNIILVKYWKYKRFSKDEIKNQLKITMNYFDSLFNSNILEQKIKKSIDIGMKYDLLTDICVGITNDEIILIDKLETAELKKIMFVLLVVWKFKGKPQRFNICNVDLMKLSEVKVRHNTFWNYIYQIIQSGILSMVEYKNKSYYRLHVESEDTTPPLFTIKYYENLTYYYLRLFEPDNYKECKCGKIIKITSNKIKYCNQCAKRIKNLQNKQYPLGK